MTSWHRYPKIFTLGHYALANLFHGPVHMQEKVDGSQLSFGVFHENGHEVLRARSKGAHIDIQNPEKLFRRGIEEVQKMHEDEVLEIGVTYRCEYLEKPKHNAQSYKRIPFRHLALFDVCINEEEYADPLALPLIAELLGIDCVPYYGEFQSMEQVESLLERESFLGGPKIEGIVLKNYTQFGTDKKVLMGKYVSDEFKEVHQKKWKKNKLNERDFFELLIQEYGTEARWNKAFMRLKESGEITYTLRDIGTLMRLVPSDIEEECLDELKGQVYRHFQRQIRKGFVRGLPEWYKKKLASGQDFGGNEE